MAIFSNPSPRRHDAGKAAVAHEKIGAGAEDEDFIRGVEPLEETGKIGLVRRLEQDLGAGPPVLSPPNHVCAERWPPTRRSPR